VRQWVRAAARPFHFRQGRRAPCADEERLELSALDQRFGKRLTLRREPLLPVADADLDAETDGVQVTHELLVKGTAVKPAS
jgi:hypothetical protein